MATASAPWAAAWAPPVWHAPHAESPAAIAELASAAGALGGLRGAYLAGLSGCLEVMWDLVQERLGRGDAVPYERCVLASTGRPPEPSRPEEKRRLVLLTGNPDLRHPQEFQERGRCQGVLEVVVRGQAVRGLVADTGRVHAPAGHQVLH